MRAIVTPRGGVRARPNPVAKPDGAGPASGLTKGFGALRPPNRAAATGDSPATRVSPPARRHSSDRGIHRGWPWPAPRRAASTVGRPVAPSGPPLCAMLTAPAAHADRVYAAPSAAAPRGCAGGSARRRSHAPRPHHGWRGLRGATNHSSRSASRSPMSTVCVPSGTRAAIGF